MQEEPFCLLALKVPLQGKLGLRDLPFSFIVWNSRMYSPELPFSNKTSIFLSQVILKKIL